MSNDQAPESAPRLAADDPRYLRSKRRMRVTLVVAIALALGFIAYVLSVVPWGATLELRQRNSGNPFQLPIFALFIWPGFYLMLLMAELREKPKSITVREYRLGSWLVYVLLAPFMAGLLIWGFEFLGAAGKL